MAETILHALKNAAHLTECTNKRGKWPISPKLDDPVIMQQHLLDISMRGTARDYREYLDVITNPTLSHLIGVQTVLKTLEFNE